MKEKTVWIGAGQMFCILLICRVVVTLTFSVANESNAFSSADCIAALCYFPFILIMMIPSCLLCGGKGSGNPVENARLLAGRTVGNISAVLYGLCFLMTASVSVASFSVFATAGVPPEHSKWFYPVLILLPALFAAVRGIEAIARISTVLAVIGGAVLLLVTLTLLSHMDINNWINPLEMGVEASARGLLLFFTNSTELISVGMVIPYCTGRKKAACIGFAASSAGIILLIVGTIVLVLGEYGSLQLFPYFSAVSLAKLGSLSRMEVFYSAVWLTGVFLKTGFFLFCSWESMRSLLHERGRKIYLCVSAGIVFVTASILSGYSLTSGSSVISMIVGSNVLLLGILFPGVLCILSAVKKRKSGSRSMKKGRCREGCGE